MTTPTVCTTDDSTEPFYCPAGSIKPKKCPPGEYVSADRQSCTTCDLGKYCWPCTVGSYCGGDISTTFASVYSSSDAERLSGIAGDCDTANGFICRNGASSSQPIQDGFELIEPGSVLYQTYSGPVIRGYIVDPDVANPGALLEC